MPLAEGDAGEDDERCGNLLAVQRFAQHDDGEEQGEQRNQVDEGRGLVGWQAADAKVEKAVGADGDEYAEINDRSRATCIEIVDPPTRRSRLT